MRYRFLLQDTVKLLSVLIAIRPPIRTLITHYLLPITYYLLPTTHEQFTKIVLTHQCSAIFSWLSSFSSIIFYCCIIWLLIVQTVLLQVKNLTRSLFDKILKQLQVLLTLLKQYLDSSRDKDLENSTL